MSRSDAARWTAMVVVLAGIGAPSASARPASGGAVAPERPMVADLLCPEGPATCRRGELLTVVGPGMEFASRVVFEGRRGRGDDRTGRPRAADGDRLTVVVPGHAHSGRVKVITSGVGASRSRQALTVRAMARTAPPETTAAAPTGTTSFPIAGKHEFLTTSVTRFGGGRGHQGQDVFAKCGTPLVAPQAAKVTNVKYQSAAGNYVVMQAADGRSFAMMHMLTPATVKVGDELTPGSPVGQVGQTGRASGCHLHFELWTAPGWYTGGAPIDPLPLLRSWDAAS